MTTLKRFSPSPAMAVASIALLVALGGTSVAAIQLAAPNSVASAQVVDGSLQKKDLNASVLAGGQPATPAPTGLGDAYGAAVDDTVAVASSDFTRVVTLRIPKAGKYVVWARTLVRSTQSPEDVISCKLEGGSTSDRSWTYMDAAFETLTSQIVADLPAGNVTFGCIASSNKGTAKQSLVTAIKVGNLTATG